MKDGVLLWRCHESKEDQWFLLLDTAFLGIVHVCWAKQQGLNSRFDDRKGKQKAVGSVARQFEPSEYHHQIDQNTGYDPDGRLCQPVWEIDHKTWRSVQ